MSDRKQNDLFSCVNICWMIAVVLGFASFMVALSRFECGAVPSMLVGIVAFFLSGWLLGKFLCSGEPKVASAPVTAPTPEAKPQARAADVASTTEASAPVEVEKAASPAASTADVVVKSSLLSGEEELASRKGDYKYEAEKPVKTAPKKAAAKKAPAKKAAAKKAAPKTETTDASEKKPRTMKAPRKAGADDLKLLKGVGPKLEQTLNELGFYHFDQVSKWGADEIAWVDARLKFKGRIERDGWIDQAKILADGGDTEFSKRGKKA